jgi:manganese/zinc/iron transport system permease protein
MLLIAPALGGAATISGYELSRGNFLGLFQVSDLLAALDRLVGLGGYTTWNTSISASMVLMMFGFFLLAWVFSPRYGLLSGMLRRRAQSQQFANQMLLGHIYNHQGTAAAREELALATLHRHLNWSPEKTRRVLRRVRLRQLAAIEDNSVRLTPRGQERVQAFILETLGDRAAI